MNNTYKSLLLTVIVTMSGPAIAEHHESYSPNEATGVAWVKAGHAGQAETRGLGEDRFVLEQTGFTISR